MLAHVGVTSAGKIPIVDMFAPVDVGAVLCGVKIITFDMLVAADVEAILGGGIIAFVMLVVTVVWVLC